MKQNLQPRKEKNAVKALEHQSLYPSCNWLASLYLVPPLPSRTDHGDMGTMGAAPPLCDRNSPFLSSLLDPPLQGPFLSSLIVVVLPPKALQTSQQCCYSQKRKARSPDQMRSGHLGNRERVMRMLSRPHHK